jgi:hypothetical protein
MAVQADDSKELGLSLWTLIEKHHEHCDYELVKLLADKAPQILVEIMKFQRRQ